MSLRKLTFLFLVLLASIAWAGGHDVEETKSAAMMVATLKNIVQWSIPHEKLRTTLELVPNSKPYVTRGKWMGQIFTKNGQETGFIHVSYDGDIPVVATYSTAPASPAIARQIHAVFEDAMRSHYTRMYGGYFNLGDGIIAELRLAENSMAVFVERQ